MTFLSLAELEIVILTTYGAASDQNVVKITTFLFQYHDFSDYIKLF